MEKRQALSVWEKLLKKSLDIVCTTDQQGCCLQVNNTFELVLGYRAEEVIGSHFSRFTHPDYLGISLRMVQEIMSGPGVYTYESRCIHKDGRVVSIFWTTAWSEEEEVMVSLGRYVAEHGLAWQKDELHKALIEHGTDLLALFDTELNCLYSGGAVLKQLGYSHEQLIGTNALSYVHPDDIPLAKEALSQALETHGHITLPAFRFKDASGEWRWLETTLSNQLENPAVKALVTSSRDVSERINNRLKLKESEQRFKSLFENHLDMVFFQNREGVIIDVNATTLAFFDAQKHEILNRPFTDFLPCAEGERCEQALMAALNGEWVRYESILTFEGKGAFVFDIAKIPVIVNGEILGAYSILRDITSVNHSNNTIRRQAEKLNAILESITDAFFTLDKRWRFTYVNNELERLFDTDRTILLGNNFWEFVDADIKAELYEHYTRAFETGVTERFKIFLETYGIWLQVKAFPSEEGLSVFMYDISEKIRAEQELEKLSLVASKTTNGVVITDKEGLIEWVNEGFTALTGYTLPEIKGKNPGSFLIGKGEQEATMRKFLERRNQDTPFHVEMLNLKKSGEKIWFLVEVSPVLDENGSVTRCITIQTDITEQKEAEARQLQLTKDLYRQNKDLQQFTYIVSHNLRSPVANAMGLVEMLQTIDKASDIFDISLGYLKKSVNQLDSVLKDLNMILSIRDKRDAVEKERIQLLEVCRQAVADYHDQLQASGGSVSLEIDEHVYVHGDKAYLYSVFHNLLSNAIKYRSPKRILKIEIKCFGCTDEGAIISFSDNGSGFDMLLAEDKVFKLYKRFHAGSEGRGIGLYLVNAHIEAMGGHIEVSSQVNVGTRFLLFLK